VGLVSDLILTSMKAELSAPIEEMRLSGLWLRVVMAQRMIDTGVEVPTYLENTFKPHNIMKMAQVLLVSICSNLLIV